MLKLKLKYFGQVMRRVDSLEKTLRLVGLGAGGEGEDRGGDGWMASPTRWAWVWVDSGSLWWTGRPGVLRFMGSQRVRHDWVTELNWWWDYGSNLSYSLMTSCHISKCFPLYLCKYLKEFPGTVFKSLWYTSTPNHTCCVFTTLANEKNVFISLLRQSGVKEDFRVLIVLYIWLYNLID